MLLPKTNAHRHTNNKRTNSVGRGLAPAENKRPRRTPPLSVILSARSTRSFLQSRLAERQKVEVQRLRCTEEIYERLPIAFLGQMNCSECTNAKEGRGMVRTWCAARSARVCDTIALRASWAFRLLHNQIFKYPFGKRTQDDRGGRFAVGVCLWDVGAPSPTRLVRFLVENLTSVRIQGLGGP